MWTGPPLPEWRNIWWAVGLCLAALFAAPNAAIAQDAEATEREYHPLEVFQLREDLLFRVGYRLATANAEFCDVTQPVSGVLLHDAEAYGEPAAVRYLFGLKGDLGVQSVAPGSPAELAGLRRNDTISALGGQAISTRWLPTRPGWQRGHDIRDFMDKELAAGTLDIDWFDAEGASRNAALTPVPACASRFELLTNSAKASADGERVLVGESFPGFAYAEDEFAALIAHEMAHNLLGHLDYFEESGRKRSLVRLSEREADRLMPWLLANADYDPVAAARFMQLWGPRHGGWIFRKRTHDGWDERVEFIEAELPLIAAAQAETGKADWRAHFERLLPLQ